MTQHVKWFVDWQSYPTQYELLLSGRTALAVGIAIAVIAGAWWVQRNVAEPRFLHVFDGLVRWGPFFVGTHTGLPLLVAALSGRLFAPHFYVSFDSPASYVTLLLEGVIGLLLLLGLFTRAAAIGLGILGPFAASFFGWEGIVEQVHFLGIAAFLFLIGRGPLSLDRVIGRHRLPPPDVPTYAVTVLRVLTGFAIAFNALTEKILNPELSLALLRERPELNAGRALGLEDPAFVLVAGVLEFAIGAWIASGQVTRLAILVAWLPFNVTLLLFGWDELLGHLPIYGVMFMLLAAPEADAWHVRQQLRREAAAA